MRSETKAPRQQSSPKLLLAQDRTDPLTTFPVLPELASVQERGNSSLANCIQNLLDPSRSPPRAALQGRHQALSLKCQLGARDAKVRI